MKSIATWTLLARSLHNKIPVMLLYVLDSTGSSPGRKGFFMAVNELGQMEGSIGGGIMEHKFVEMAKEKLLAFSDQADIDIRKQYHDKLAKKDQSGMICSGDQTILLYLAQQKDLVAVKKVIDSLTQYRNGALILSPRGIAFNDTTPEKDHEYIYQSDDDWVYREKTGYRNRLFIIGGGHCSLAFSNLMGQMDFYISVYDERKDLKTMLENKSAHEKHIVPDYSVLKEMVPAGIHHYAVVMTFGYRTDDIALRALLGKDLKYIGLLGSKTKVEKMFAAYRHEGIPEEQLNVIHTPIGIAIKSETPEEIAVSIAAEIISVKNVDR